MSNFLTPAPGAGIVAGHVEKGRAGDRQALTVYRRTTKPRHSRGFSYGRACGMPSGMPPACGRFLADSHCPATLTAKRGVRVHTNHRRPAMRGTNPHTPTLIARAVHKARLDEAHDMLTLALDAIHSRYRGVGRPLAITEAESYLRRAQRLVETLSEGGAA